MNDRILIGGVAVILGYGGGTFNPDDDEYTRKDALIMKQEIIAELEEKLSKKCTE